MKNIIQELSMEKHEASQSVSAKYVTFKADTNNSVDINHRFSFPCFETKYHPNPISQKKKIFFTLHHYTIHITMYA